MGEQSQDHDSQGTSHPPKAKGGGVFWRLFRWLGFLRNGEEALAASLEDVIEEHEDLHDRELGQDERDMLINVLNYGELRVDDIMVPRADIIAVNENISFDGLMHTFSTAAHSRLPVFMDTLDEIVGMIHVKDIVKALADNKSKDGEGDKPNPPSVKSLMRPVLFVAPSMKPGELMSRMKSRRTHMALVVDEYGGTDGLITIEDLIEQIVGDIDDEHDEEVAPALEKLEKDCYLADARLEMEDLEKELGVDLLPDERDEDVDTVGGLVVSLAGRVPKRGEIIHHTSGYDFKVVEADPRRLKKVRIQKRPK
jgi:CBS domain containing-hemolysin-like protein